MRTKRKTRGTPKMTRLLAIIMAIMLIIYNTPVGVFSSALAETVDSVETTPVEEPTPPVEEPAESEEVPVETEEVVETPAEKETTEAEEEGPPVKEEAPTPKEEAASPKEEVTPSTEEAASSEEDKTESDIDNKPEPVVETYQVSVAKVENGTVEMIVDGAPYDGKEKLEVGKVVQLQITPDPHYEIASIIKKVNGEETDITEAYKNGIEVEVEGDTVVQVDFKKKMYTVSLAQTDHNKNGTVEIKTSDGKKYKFGDPDNLDEIKFEAEEKAFLKITPDDAYTVGSVKMSVGGKEQTITSTYTNGIEITGNTKLFVEYSEKTYTITFNSNEHGTIDYDKKLESIGGTIKLEHGKSTSFTVKPYEGYHVKSIVINDKELKNINAKGDTYTLDDVRKNHTVVVTFAINTYEVSASFNRDKGEVMLDNNGNQGKKVVADHGSNVVVTMTPDSLYTVGSLKVNGEEQVKQETGITNDENFSEDENGNITFTISEFTDKTTIEVTFTEVSTEMEAWENYLSIALDSGSKITEPIVEGDHGKNVFVYSNDAKLKLTSKLELYDRIHLLNNDHRGWSQELRINSNATIDQFLLKKNRGKWKIYVDLPKPLTLVFDTEKPVVENTTLSGANEKPVGDKVWYSDKVTVSGNINNIAQEFDGVSYSTKIIGVYYEAKDGSSKGEATFDPEKNTYSFSIDTDEGTILSQTYHVWAVDEAGNRSEVKTVDVNIDKGVPTLADGKAVTFNVINNDSWSKFLNILTFGTFFNEAIEVTVIVKDDASGFETIDSIDLNTSVDGVDPSEVKGSFIVDGLTAQAKFTLDINELDVFEGTFTVDVKDNVNNTQTYEVNDQNSNTEPGSNGVVMIEKKAPKADITVTPNNENESSSSDDYYNGDVTFTINTHDEQSGVNNVKMNINGKEIKHDYSKEEARKTTPLTYTISTSDYVKNHDGSYELEVVAQDNAGNTTTASKTVYVDKDVPTLAKGEEKPVKIDTINDTKWAQFLNFLTFGTFFNEAIKVDVKVEDDVSGIESIEFKAFDEAGNEIPEVNQKQDFDKRTLAAQAQFTIESDAFAGTLKVEVTDKVNNKEVYEITKDNSNIAGDHNLVMIDKNKPELEINVVPLSEDTFKKDNYYSGDVTFEVDVQDPEAGVNHVVIDINGTKYEHDYSKEDARTTSKLTYPIRTDDPNNKINEDGSYDISVHVTDNAGNTHSADENIYIDKAVPTLAQGEAVTFTMINDGPVAKALNFLTFGTFFNKAIEVTVKAEDDVAGVESVGLHTSDEKVVPQLKDFVFDGLNASATFTLDHEDFTGTFAVEVTDHVKNSKTYEVTNANSNIVSDNNTVMFDKNNPEADISIIPNKKVSSNGDNQYNGDVTFAVEVQDSQSGVNSVTIDVNGKKYEYEYLTEKINTPLTYNIRTDDPENVIGADGSYVVSVHVTDNAGNTQSTEETVFIDKTDPIITELTFSNEEKTVKVEENNLQGSVELKNYGYYFKKATKVTVKADDPKVENQFTSGVKSMTVYLQDHDTGTYYAVQGNGSLKRIAESEIGRIAPLTNTKEVTFNVPAAFKGQIFAKAVDHVQNTSGFKTPDGAIVETASKHAQESHINLEKAEAQYRDTNGLDLYAGNVNVNLTVTDTYSGISEIQWSVKAPYDTDQNQGGTVKINNDKTYAAGSDTTGWQQTKTDKNLVTEMKKTITVANNSNDIVVEVKMTDRAGNVSEDEMTFSIDKSAPSIAVTYDNNTADAENADFYNQDRTATIVITERNFKPGDVDYRITNTDRVIPRLVGWSTARNAANPDQTTHTATIRYSADGDYTFDISYQDNAGHTAAPIQQDKFTIDKTKPEIHVSYNNNSAANGNYYNADRTATISITEHNFDPSRIRVSGSASDNGEPVGFPGLSGWSRSGDVNTATIHYAADAKYSFDIDYTDMAGNVMDDFPMEEFVIDQTAPALEITGVADQSANNGDVAPIVTYSDTNFNKEAVSITLQGANRGPVKLDGRYSDAANGGGFTFNNFAKEKEIDDLYTLTATLVDHAGNETTEKIRFSVNRFGSVYVFDESLKSIEGKYVKNERDVIVTETNVDSLNPDSIHVKMTKNGVPSDLAVESDYTVQESGGGGSWSQYTYTVKKEMFAGDGKYTVAIYSEDRAGNVNENIDEVKKAEISFGIDKTAPVIVPINIESGVQYPVDSKVATVSINDNLVLDDAKVYLNNKEVEVQNEGENFTFGIGNSNSKQNVRIVAVDAAGNELVEEVNDFLVTTNLIARWYNNTPLFYGSIGGVGGIAIILSAYFLLRNRKKKIEIIEDDQQTFGG
ncbi:Ig-like domain repeat protein [Niallia sp. XMNu-256]|uniref:Ig-like domain repeat protein n=1 Tax=Niallia sp. XMNu-256 TaxID=3082444 RepID=UPI0030D56F53